MSRQRLAQEGGEQAWCWWPGVSTSRDLELPPICAALGLLVKAALATVWWLAAEVGGM